MAIPFCTVKYQQRQKSAVALYPHQLWCQQYTRFQPNTQYTTFQIGRLNLSSAGITDESSRRAVGGQSGTEDEKG